MSALLRFCDGVCFGCGLIVAALVMKTLFHIGWC